MEERVGAGADHDPLGQPRDETAAHRGQDQRQSRRDAGEVRLECYRAAEEGGEEVVSSLWKTPLPQVVSTRQHLDKAEVPSCKTNLEQSDAPPLGLRFQYLL